MKRRKVIVGIGSAALALAASVFAAQSVKAERETGKCYPTEDGKFVCKTKGDLMDAPCCEKPCCK